jgi:hypothetical protein
MMKKSRRQKPGARRQKDKAEAGNQEPEEKRRKSVKAVLGLIFWLLASDS